MAAVTIAVDEDDYLQLERIVDASNGAWETVTELVEQLARAAADGARRPGAWERDWIIQATGVLL